MSRVAPSTPCTDRSPEAVSTRSLSAFLPSTSAAAAAAVAAVTAANDDDEDKDEDDDDDDEDDEFLDSLLGNDSSSSSSSSSTMQINVIDTSSTLTSIAVSPEKRCGVSIGLGMLWSQAVDSGIHVDITVSLNALLSSSFLFYFFTNYYYHHHCRNEL